jgi:hypothetical protein|tara:strand:+ start:443 stop:1033 length:591 start_codon:yes stop_codon:yes gene_type:complete
MKELLENWNKYLLTESSLSRIYGHIMDHDSAILTAFRNEYSKKQNYKRNRELKAQLLSLGYGVTKVAGSYIENFESPQAVEVSEQSYFVSNRKDAPGFVESIKSLGEQYEQDSVLIIPEGGKDAYLIGTREGNDFPPFGDQISVGDLKMGRSAEFMSKVKGRPIVFKEELETYDKLSKNSRWTVKKMVENVNKKNS